MLTIISANISDVPQVQSHIQIPLSSTVTNPTYAFLTGLHLFASALISHYVSQRDLHARRAQYIVQEIRAKPIPSPISLPSLFIKLSSILASKNISRRTGKAWAKDILRITFQGIQTSLPKPLQAETVVSSGYQDELSGVTAGETSADIQKTDTLVENAVMIAQANMAIPVPSSLLVSQRIDKDIAFHPSSGAFAFRLQNKVGEPAITSLTERLQRVEQFVDFVQVVKHHEKTLRCETVSLGKVVFTYSLPAMTVDSRVTTYRATVDFAGVVTPLALTLEKGNPHVRILDHLTKVLNSSLGLDGVATLLPLTLPLLRGLDAIENAWLPLLEKGEVGIFVRAADWYTIRYTPPYSSDPEANSRWITFDIRLQQRNAIPWWCIRRNCELGATAADDIDTALKSVWDGNGEAMSWRGMQSAGIAKKEGVEALLARVDGCVREMVQSGLFASQSRTQTTASLPGPEHNIDRSRGGLQNQNQNQGGGQGQPTGRNGARHEMIVID